MHPYLPLVRNPDLLTIAAALWPRPAGRRYPVNRLRFQSAPDIPIIVDVQRAEELPAQEPRGNLILVHGLEGSSANNYMRSMAAAALAAGFDVHRFNLRNCGGTELEIPDLYHGGLTDDLLAYVRSLAALGCGPVFLMGFSLGGNIVLKLAGELGTDGPRWLAGVCSASTPVDLAACARRIGAPRNRIYERRFLDSMIRRIRAKEAVFPGRYPVGELPRLRTLYDFDDRVTAPLAGFRNAEHYYSTQSCLQFLPDISIPALLIQAQDDPLIPFELFKNGGFHANPHVEFLATTYGGHLGFLSRGRPRFWLDQTVITWIRKKCQENAGKTVD